MADVLLLNIIAECLTLIAHDDDDALEVLLGQLTQQSVNEAHAVYWHHALGVVLRIFA